MPGRVVGHMRDTARFEEQLSGIDWLVIDDADRLLQQSHQDWLPRLMASVERKPAMSSGTAAAQNTTAATAAADAGAGSGSGSGQKSGVEMVEGMSLCDWVVRNDPNMRDAEVALGWRRGVRKLILSATLTRHPAKLHSLRLHRPLHLHAATENDHGGKGGEANRFSLPSTLTERVAVVPPGAKPLALLLELQTHFGTKKPPQIKEVKEQAEASEYDDEEGPMDEDDDPEEEAEEEVEVVVEDDTAKKKKKKKKGGGVIVFAATVETSHRLARLLQLYGGLAVAEYSARLKPQERQSALKKLAKGTLQVLVCSDVLSRGIDVAGVTLVVNYDAPSHPKTYIHRVGRTARYVHEQSAVACDVHRFVSQIVCGYSAGKRGTAVTLLVREEVRFFTQLRKKASLATVKPEAIASFRAREAERYDIGGRCEACLGERRAGASEMSCLR